MTETASGAAFVFGDNIDTDVLAPGHLMKLPPEELARHCLEAVDAAFAHAVKPGDYVIGGRNFGMGSSREQAAISLKSLGVRAVIAQSFARIFYRNAMNIGLLAVVVPESDRIRPADRLILKPECGEIQNLTQECSYRCRPVPPHLMKMIEDGGLIPHLKQRLSVTNSAGIPN
jgi:3-isopropylmalate/(R)-2-methylmalate dehydratase small subunit